MNFGPFDKQTKFGGRLAPDLHGSGLLQAITTNEIIGWSDPEDSNNDGVSGRANFIDGPVGKQLGRFGWKAGKVSIRRQTAAALNVDLGLSNTEFPNHAGDCTKSQAACQDAPHGDSPRLDNLEVSEEMLRLISVYVSGLRPPINTSDNEGLLIFTKTGCAACHRPEFTVQKFGTITPYTDLLLHDMGDELADGIGDGQASGHEWRTPPLWGLNKATRFLHDGRASGLDGAIKLHGGEAGSSKTRYDNLSAAERNKLLNFLSNL